MSVRVELVLRPNKSIAPSAPATHVLGYELHPWYEVLPAPINLIRLNCTPMSERGLWTQMAIPLIALGSETRLLEEEQAIDKGYWPVSALYGLIGSDGTMQRTHSWIT